MPLVAYVGSSQTIGAASGGKIYGYNNITNANSTTVANSNPSRVRISFHNPGPIDLYISPVQIQNVIGTPPATASNIPFAPTVASPGGTFRLYGNGGTISIEGECQGAWQALADSGSNNSLTVMESNV